MGSRPRVLLVEDDADVRRLYAIGLNRRGFEVRLAANGAEAVERIGEERPDFLLLDWVMPLMDGAAVVERIEQLGSNGVDVIVVSGHPAPPDVPPRVRSWLSKPVTIDELVAAMSRAKSPAGR